MNLFKAFSHFGLDPLFFLNPPSYIHTLLNTRGSDANLNMKYTINIQDVTWHEADDVTPDNQSLWGGRRTHCSWTQTPGRLCPTRHTLVHCCELRQLGRKIKSAFDYTVADSNLNRNAESRLAAQMEGRVVRNSPTNVNCQQTTNHGLAEKRALFCTAAFTRDEY